MSKPGPHRIVFANEKGGTGKSTTAVHVAIALAYQGKRVAAIDLDHRQRTLHRYLENRAETCARRAIELPTADFAVYEGDIDGLEAKWQSWPRATSRALSISSSSTPTAATTRWRAMPHRRLTRWSPR